MSKSREAIDKEKNQNIDQENVEPTTNPPYNVANTESRYRQGRESSTDFPRRSRSPRYRDETDRQTSERTNYSNRYNLGASAGRSRYEQPDRYDQPARYENVNYRNEDSGDFYSRSIRERQRIDEYDRAPRRENQGRFDRERRPDRQDRSFASSYNPRSAYPYNFDTERRERDEYDNRSRDESRFNRETYRANDPNWTPTGYAPEEYGYQNYGDQGWYTQNAQGYPYQLTCRDIMTRDVTCCAPETNLRQVAEKMEDDNVGSVPVVENGRLIGLVTDRDIVCRVLANGQDTRTATAREAMTDDIVTCNPDESVIEAIHKMGEHQVRRIPICDANGKLRGIISMGDIALEAERNVELAHALEQISQPKKYWQNQRR